MSNPAKIGQLFSSAQAQGVIGAESAASLQIPDLGAQIQAAMGVGVDDVASSEVVLVTLMPDDSGSIRFGGNAQLVRDGHNGVVEALSNSKSRDAILAHCRYLNGHVLYPYRPVAQAERMTAQNYDPSQGTPLYDQTVLLLGTVLAKAQQFADAGVLARTVTLIITDGDDEGSTRSKAKDVRRIVSDLQRQETHIVAAMGIYDGGQTDFREVFRQMGIEDRWILTPGSKPEEIRRAFQVFSQSAVKASQSARGFGAAAVGGFGA
jgi:hypothetical protein